MPVRYVIDGEQRLVVSTASGRVTFDEFKAHQDQLSSDPAFSADFNQLLDGTEVTALDLSTDEVIKMTRRRVFSPASKRAFVAPQPAIFGVARMAEVYHEISKVVVANPRILRPTFCLESARPEKPSAIVAGNRHQRLKTPD